MPLDFDQLPVTLRPSPDALSFWEGVGAGHLVLPRCRTCDELFFYPRTMCPWCGSRDHDHEQMSGGGTVHAFAIHHVPPPGYDKTHVPFVTALVQLGEGPRVMGLLRIEPRPDAVRCDMPVRIAFTVDAAGSPAFYFEPA